MIDTHETCNSPNEQDGTHSDRDDSARSLDAPGWEVEDVSIFTASIIRAFFLALSMFTQF